jgi:hypothetical protein
LTPSDANLAAQVGWLLLLAIPIACVAWTITHEEILREPREWMQRLSEQSRFTAVRKLCYIFTCEYCFSHYVAAITLAIVPYRLLLDDWRGVGVAFFALVWVANIYMSVFQRLRVDIRTQRAEAQVLEDKAAGK